MTASISSEGHGMLAIDLVGVSSVVDAAQGAIANPEGCTLMILRSSLYVQTQPDGAANLGIGIAANATTKATDIVNDLAIGAATGKVYNGSTIQPTAKTEITAPALWTVDKYLTVSGSASLVGFVGTLFVEYVRLP